MENIKKIMLFAAKEAGHIASRGFNSEKEKKNKSSRIDIVTNIDIESENRIVEIISDRFPDHDIVTEETDIPLKNSEYKWIIDPIDGTTNYYHNYPFYCISIGLQKNNETVMGVVYAPYMGEIFFAEKGKGAFLNDKQIFVSGETELQNSLLATGFPYDIANSEDNNLNYFNTFVKKAQAVRRDGAAALDLCYVACGRFDGFWELKLKSWDMCAGELIVREAGGAVSNFYVDDFDLYEGTIIAGNKDVFVEMKKLFL